MKQDSKDVHSLYIKHYVEGPLSSKGQKTRKLDDNHKKCKHCNRLVSRQWKKLVTHSNACTNSKYSRFAELAICIIEKPGTNAGVERIFNPYRIIHDWKRNRLGRDLLDKMVFIYISERLFERLGLVPNLATVKRLQTTK